MLINASVAKLKQPPIYFARGQQDRFHALIANEEAEYAAKANGDAYSQEGQIDSFEEYREKEKAAGVL